MKKANIYILIMCLFICSSFFVSCNNSSKKKENVKTEGTENKNSDGDYAKLELEDGNVIELKSPRQSGGRSLPSRFHLSLSGQGIIVILQLTSTDGPITEKKYGDIGLGITVKNLNGEDYRSFFENKDTGEEGEAETTITSIGDKHVNGTFSGTLFSKSGKKATIEGKFATVKKKEKRK